MLWVYLAVALGLLGLGAEILLSYRKEQGQLIRDMNTYTQAINDDRQAVAVLKDKIESLEKGLEELAAERDKLNKDIHWQDQNLGELMKRDEHRHMGRTRLDRD